MKEPRWPELPDPPSEGLVILHLARLVERGWSLDPMHCDACLYAWLLMNDAASGHAPSSLEQEGETPG